MFTPPRAVWAPLAVSLLTFGCVEVCETDFDCGDESYCDENRGLCRTDCFTDYDCEHPPGCESSDEGCAPIGTLCMDGRCAGPPFEGVDPPVGADEDGWNDAPGSGRMFVVGELAIGAADVGFNLDGRCEPTCVDNVLWGLGRHANGPIRQGIRGANNFLIIEIAGLIEPYNGRDDAVTLKIYEAGDGDADASNDFSGSGLFSIRGTSLDGNGQANTRVRAAIRDERLVSLEPFDLSLTLSLAANNRPTIAFDDMQIAVVAPKSLVTLDEGVLGGALRASSLHAIPNPYCRAGGPLCNAIFEDSSLLDLVAITIDRRPDLDIDADGGECVLDTDGDQRIDVCCNGVAPLDECISNRCDGTPIAPIGAEASSCALHPELADGYSVGMALSAVAGTVVAIQ